MNQINHVLLDMDGVIADFIRGVFEIHDIKETIEELYTRHLGEWDLFKILGMPAAKFWKPMDFEFWSKLEPMPDGFEIIKHLEERFGRNKITIWTSPSLNYGCHEGKLRWVERYLDRHYKHNIVFGSKKELGAAQDTILIDDADHNINKFFARGGRICLVPRIWNSDHSNRHRSLEVMIQRLDEIEKRLSESRNTEKGLLT
jgi:5'(3')-deoxyribonucleotidase